MILCFIVTGMINLIMTKFKDKLDFFFEIRPNFFEITQHICTGTFVSGYIRKDHGLCHSNHRGPGQTDPEATEIRWM